MAAPIERAALIAALEAAGQAHHEYEQNILNGVHDDAWPGWYAAYVLGRLGDFTSPSRLSRLLKAAPSDGNWYANAAEHVLKNV